MKRYYKYQRDDQTKFTSEINRECKINENIRTAATPLIVNIMSGVTPCLVENVDMSPQFARTMKPSEDKLHQLVSFNSSDEG